MTAADVAPEADLFRPAIAPARAGGLVFFQGSQRIVVDDAEVETFLRECEQVRRRQLVADCLRVAEGFRGLTDGG